MKLLCFSYMEVDRQSRHVEALLMDPRNVDELVLVLAGRLDQVRRRPCVSCGLWRGHRGTVAEGRWPYPILHASSALSS